MKEAIGRLFKDFTLEAKIWGVIGIIFAFVTIVGLVIVQSLALVW